MKSLRVSSKLLRCVSQLLPLTLSALFWHKYTRLCSVRFFLWRKSDHVLISVSSMTLSLSCRRSCRLPLSVWIRQANVDTALSCFRRQTNHCLSEENYTTQACAYFFFFLYRTVLNKTSLACRIFQIRVAITECRDKKVCCRYLEVIAFNNTVSTKFIAEQQLTNCLLKQLKPILTMKFEESMSLLRWRTQKTQIKLNLVKNKG